MVQVENCDVVSEKGERSIAEGLKTVAGRAILTGFAFSEGVKLSRYLSCKRRIDFEKGEVSFKQVMTFHQRNLSDTKTRLLLQIGFVIMDFEAEQHKE